MTGAIDSKHSGPGVGSTDEPPDGAPADHWPARAVRGRNPQHRVHPVAVDYKQFRTIDGQAARRFFASAYQPGWRISGLTGHCAVSHRRSDAGSMTLDEVMIQGQLTLEIPASNTIVVIQPRTGSLSIADGPVATRDFPVLIAHGIPCVLHCNGARFDVITIEADVLHKVAADWHTPLAQQTRFVNRRPRSRSAVRAWHRALDYVVATAEDIGINDVAAAVHLTPRAVQYLFRRQLDTTPTQYMRRIRLGRAHDELMAATTATSTVTEIAQRWGFAHTGRFAVLYRQTYGQSPHAALRQRASWS